MVLRGAWVLALAIGLSACGEAGRGGEPDRHESGGAEGHSGRSGRDLGMEMHEAMASAVGSDVSDTWVRKMIAHHQGAVAITDSVVAEGGDPEVAAIARRMGAAQRREIEEMKRWVRKDAAPDPASARPYLASEKQMHEAMTAAGGADSSQAFLRQMIPHHQGAIAMSEIVLAQGRDERVADLARRIVADQGKEIGEMEAMLSKRSRP
ncbi:MAG TPA: DUF305 domain-containing protein [Allosphingosinicella sp.]|nr:DUF305 domain-containing protein [Allosphingosinicella sp.]